MTTDPSAQAHILPVLVPMSDHHDRHEVAVWLYDTKKERMPGADNPSQRYACVGSLGSFQNHSEAAEAASVYPLFQGLAPLFQGLA